VQAAVERKVEGHEITMAEPPESAGGAQVIDLMDALRASLERKSPARAKDRRGGARGGGAQAGQTRATGAARRASRA
jgi:DNA end-binding protein Ku